MVPSYEWWEAPFYGVGLKVYNLLSGRYGFGASEILSKEETLARLPGIRTEGLRGGVVYYDGQFDDTRLLVNMATTAAEQGATLLNYAPVRALTRDKHGFVNGVVATDLEGGREIRAAARVVINAGGPFCDAVRRLADPGLPPLVAPSQGIHLVFPGSVLPGGAAIMVPHTSDGRVMFAIPWHGHTVVGTTDTPIEEASLEPRPFDDEIEFVLETASRYLHRPLTRADVLSVFVGIRPLVRSGDAKSTAALSRDHLIHIDPTGLITVTGGKWTTWRSMAEHCVDTAAMLEHLPEKPCPTRNLNIHGFHRQAARFGPLAGLRVGRPPHPGPRPRRSGARGAAASRPADLRRRGGVGGAVRDGPHGRGRAGPAHTGPLPERPGGDRDGSRGGRAPGPRARARPGVAGRAGDGVSGVGRGLRRLLRRLAMSHPCTRQAIALAVLFSALASRPAETLAAEPPAPYGPVPSARQLRWHELEFYGFLHFTVNTFTDKEWGYGDESPGGLQPHRLRRRPDRRGREGGGHEGPDPHRQAPRRLLPLAAQAHRALGQEQPVAGRQGRRGPRDLRRLPARTGCSFGVYLSPWDRNHPDYGRPAYLDLLPRASSASC